MSDDRRGDAAGVARQRDDCQALATAKGWTVERTFVDNDVSAYSGKPRPGYRELLDTVQAGRADVVVAWHPDRLHRSPVELEEFIALVEAHGVAVETVQAGRWDLSTPSGRFVARQLGGVARYESEHKSERVRRALEQNASKGRSHGRRAYGWQRIYDTDSGRGRDVLDPAEAEVIRTIAQRIISGDSIRSIVQDLNSRGVPSPAGKAWGPNKVRAVVMRERNAGLRVHHGEVIGEGAWEPILDRGTYDQLRAVLVDPQRRTSVSSAAAHLLSGIARCGVCGSVIRASMNRSVPSYTCQAGRCVSRNRRDVDDLVIRVVTGRLAREDAADLLAPDRSDERRAAVTEARDLRARLDRAADDYADGKIDARQLERITARLRPQVDAAHARARIVDDSPLLDGIIGRPDAAEVWETLSLTRQRAIVDLLMTVRIMRAKPGARVFDPETVEIAWRQP
jgi:DNA invertase Pin-like site-specific DNA recombinase